MWQIWDALLGNWGKSNMYGLKDFTTTYIYLQLKDYCHDSPPGLKGHIFLAEMTYLEWPHCYGQLGSPSSQVLHQPDPPEFCAQKMEISNSENANFAPRYSTQTSVLRKCKFHANKTEILCSENANCALKTCQGAVKRPPRIWHSENGKIRCSRNGISMLKMDILHSENGKFLLQGNAWFLVSNLAMPHSSQNAVLNSSTAFWLKCHAKFRDRRILDGLIYMYSVLWFSLWPRWAWCLASWSWTGGWFREPIKASRWIPHLES